MTTATETKLSKAETIGAIARYKTHAQYSASMGTRLGCFGDVNHGVLKVDAHQWEHIARRAKTFPECERIEMGRGWHGSVDGRAWLEVVADDGSRCTVVLV